MRVVETIKQAFSVFADMELPMEERVCVLSHDAAMTLIDELERVERERDAAIATMAEHPRCETCKHFTPGYFCLGCKHDLGGGCCRLNLESECREGGGFELREPKGDEEVVVE